MALIYFFRHGQAGTRDDYDKLSDLGRRQAALLGDWIRAEGLTFDRVICGGLKRQQDTASIALGSLDNVTIDQRWSEFDLDAVYGQIAPLLANEDDGFRSYWEELQRTIAGGNLEVHRQWAPPDALVVEAWIGARYATPVESWEAFVARVIDGGSGFTEMEDGQRIAIFTSATPISIWVSHVLGGLGPERIMHFAGASLNTAMTVLHRGRGETSLFSFNAVPHLTDPGLRTSR